MVEDSSAGAEAALAAGMAVVAVPSLVPSPQGGPGGKGPAYSKGDPAEFQGLLLYEHCTLFSVPSLCLAV